MIYSGRPGTGPQAVMNHPQGPTATEKQVDLILKLAAEQGTSRDAETVARMPRHAASTLIDLLIETGKAMRTIQRQQTVGKPRAGSVDDGVYRLPDGRLVKVQWNQAETSKYAKIWQDGEWVYDGVRGVYRQLAPEMALSAQDAKAFGDLYGRCVYCSRKLTDERSISAGYGEKCADDRGLPWG
jgi:hypothetical protein